MTDQCSHRRPASGARRVMARHLVGHGLDLGPGAHPFDADLPGTRSRLVDRWDAAANTALFPELAGFDFPQPDIVADLDVDRLSAVSDGGEDFVIASHVLEHLADPLGMLVECHRVLRPGGTLLLLLPDRRRTSDVNRPATTLEHLVEEHAQGVTEVDDDHLVEFLTMAWKKDLSDPAERERLIKENRERSVHAHCWVEEEFFEVIAHTVAVHDCRWELLELLRTEDVARSREYGWVLRRSVSDEPSDVLLTRLRANRDLLLAERERQGARTARLERLVANRERTASRIERQEAALERARSRLQARTEQLARAKADVARLTKLEATLRRRAAVVERPLSLLRRTPAWPLLRRVRRAVRSGSAPGTAEQRRGERR